MGTLSLLTLSDMIRQPVEFPITAEARKAYLAEIERALKAFDASIDSAWKAKCQAERQVKQEYEMRLSQITAEFLKISRPAHEVFEKVRLPALEVYESAAAAELEAKKAR